MDKDISNHNTLTVFHGKGLKQKDFNKDLEGINFLRGLVNSFNFRHEYLNENKTPQQLIKEFENILNGEIDVYGTPLTEY